MNTDHVFECFQKFLIKQDLADRTVQGYLDDLKYFCQWLEELYDQTISITTVTVIELQAFRQYLINAKRQKVTSVNRRIQAIKRFFKWAVHEKIIQEDPTETFRFMKRPPSLQPVALNKTQVHKLLRAAGQSSHGMSKRNYAMIQLMLQAGCRVGELVKLRYSDIKISPRSGVIDIVDSKGFKSRQVPLNLTARRALTNYFKLSSSRQNKEPVFISKRGQAMTVRAVQAVLLNVVKRAKLTNIQISSHTLRHTFASQYLQANPGQLVELAQLLGHDSLNTTAIYTKPTKAQLSESIERSEINIYGDA